MMCRRSPGMFASDDVHLFFTGNWFFLFHLQYILGIQGMASNLRFVENNESSSLRTATVFVLCHFHVVATMAKGQKNKKLATKHYTYN
jgi:hypothetical protein